MIKIPKGSHVRGGGGHSEHVASFVGRGLMELNMQHNRLSLVYFPKSHSLFYFIFIIFKIKKFFLRHWLMKSIFRCMI